MNESTPPKKSKREELLKEQAELRATLERAMAALKEAKGEAAALEPELKLEKGISGDTDIVDIMRTGEGKEGVFDDLPLQQASAPAAIEPVTEITEKAAENPSTDAKRLLDKTYRQRRTEMRDRLSGSNNPNSEISKITAKKLVKKRNIITNQESAVKPTQEPQPIAEPEKKPAQNVNVLDGIAAGSKISFKGAEYTVTELPNEANGNRYGIARENVIYRRSPEKMNEAFKSGEAVVAPTTETGGKSTVDYSKDFWAPLPATPSVEKSVAQAVKEISPEDKEKLGQGLNTLGFRVEKKKNDFLAGAFDRISKKGDQKGTIARFTRGLRDSYIKDADAAQKKIKAGKEMGKLTKLSNYAYLSKNILRPMRLIADITGLSPTGAQRLVMAGAMMMGRATGAMKEARLANEEEVLEKTRIQDADAAAEEAWEIYNNAQKKAGADGNVSADQLKMAYLREIPKDLQERLRKTTSGPKLMVQVILKKHLDFDINRLNKKIDKIEKDAKLSPERKEILKEQILRRWENRLTDYDRVLTQTGTVDEYAMAARYAEVTSKNIVRAMTIQTAYLTLEKVWGGIAHLLSGSDVPDLTEVKKAAGEAVRKSVEREQPPSNSGTTKPWENLERDEGGARTSDIRLPNETPQAIEPGISDKPVEPGMFPPESHVDISSHIAAGEPSLPSRNIISPSIMEAPGASVLEVENISVTKGNGGIQEIIDLKEHIAKHYNGNYESAPKGIQELMSSKDATGQAIKWRLYDPNNPKESALLREGSSWKVDYKTGNISLNDPRTGENILINGNSGEIKKFSGTMFDSDKKGPSLQTPQAEVRPETDTINSAQEGDAAGLEDQANSITENNSPGNSSENLTEMQTPEAPQAPDAVEAARNDLFKKYDAAAQNNPPENLVTEPTVRAEIESLPGITEDQYFILQTHPEFARNHFRLPARQLMQAYDNHDRMVRKIFPGDKINDWRRVENTSVSRILRNGSSRNSVGPYIERIQRISGENPRTGIFGIRGETTGKYVARAMQRIVRDGKGDRLFRNQ